MSVNLENAMSENLDQIKRIAISAIVSGIIGGLGALMLATLMGWLTKGGMIQALGGVTNAKLETVTTSLASEEQFRQLSTLMDRAVILTDQECSLLGPEWKRFEKLDGRFPLASGQHEDDRGESLTFVVDQTGGRYKHVLITEEMPSHTHVYHDRHLNDSEGGSRMGDEDDRERHRPNERRVSAPTGGDQPHPNMPPYRVVNFCYKERAS